MLYAICHYVDHHCPECLEGEYYNAERNYAEFRYSVVMFECHCAGCLVPSY